MYHLTRNDYKDMMDKRYLLIDHAEYRKPGTYEYMPINDPEWEHTSYAFGLNINPFYTSIVPIDYDGSQFEHADQLVQRYMQAEDVVGVDIVQSSEHNHHIYLGLKAPKNICALYDTSEMINACFGFCRCISVRKEITIRVSPKFGKSPMDLVGWQHGTTIVPKRAYRRVDDKKWHVFEEHQIVAPIQCSKLDLKEDIPRSRKKTLRLR